MRLAAGTRLGAYEVLGTLGARGMGEVYRARDSRLERPDRPLLPVCWTSDPRYLFVRSQGAVPERIYKLDVETGREELWKEIAPADRAGVSAIMRITVTPDGSSYAYFCPQNRSQLYLVQSLN